MPALPSDIMRATRAVRVVTWTGTSAPGGRDGLRAIEPGYFENNADADAVLASKATLIGVTRRRFGVSAQGEVAIDPAQEIPSFQLVDEELSVDLPVMLTRYEYDMETETSTLEVLG